MKTSHENIRLIENWLLETDTAPLLTDDFVRRVYDTVLEHLYKLNDTESIKKRNRAYKLQYDFVRRDLLKIIYKRNNSSATGIKAGFVYAIANPAWPDYVKIGSAIDVVDRLNSYQTSSPHRDYSLLGYYFTHDRVADEYRLHQTFGDRQGEWCKITADEATELFKQLQQNNRIDVLPEKLLAIKQMRTENAQTYKAKPPKTKRVIDRLIYT